MNLWFEHKELELLIESIAYDQLHTQKQWMENKDPLILKKLEEKHEMLGKLSSYIGMCLNDYQE